MKKLFAKKEVSDHIRIEAFPTAKEKGEIVLLGSLVGFADIKTEAGQSGSIDIGKMAAVYQAAKADVTGAAAIGADVYVTSAGDLTITAGSNKLLGTIVAVGGDTVDIAVIG
jgi:predicted RecA/RadA family phage recombinase